MDLYLVCNGCGQVFHAMNYTDAFQHGSAVNPSEWCGESGFILTDSPTNL